MSNRLRMLGVAAIAVSGLAWPAKAGIIGFDDISVASGDYVVISNPYAGFEPIPNRQRAWKKQEMIDGDELVVIAIQTAG